MVFHDIKTEYTRAARHEAERIAEDLRFKLLSCVLSVRTDLQNLGCQTDHVADDHRPLVYLFCQSGTFAQVFKLTIPDNGKNIVLTGNSDDRVSIFRLRDDDGFIPLSRFQDMSLEMTHHIVQQSHAGTRPCRHNTALQPINP